MTSNNMDHNNLNLAAHQFAKEIVYDILRRYPLEVGQFALENYAPGLYGLYGKRIVEHNFSLYKERISKYYSKDYYENFDEGTFNKIANAIINNNGKMCQRFENFYIMCLQLGLLCAVALEKGYADAVACTINRIESLAKIYYLARGLDVDFDMLFNFAYGVLDSCLICYEEKFELNRLIQRLDLDLDPNALDYFAWNEHALRDRIGALKEEPRDFRKLSESTKKNTNLKGFESLIRSWLRSFNRVRSLCECIRKTFLSVLAPISVYSCIAKPLFPDFILFAHETIVKLSISAARLGIIYRR